MTSNIIDILGVNTLALRGLGTEFNKFSRFFSSKDDAIEAVQTGDYVPTPGQANAVLILGIGIAIYSFDLEDFVAIQDLLAAGNQASRYIELDGADDYIEFTGLQGGTADVLDWSKNWSIGITLVGLTETTNDQKFMTLFSNGGNAIYLRRGGTNWGLYVTGDGGSYLAGANTWYAPNPTSRILFAYDAAAGRLKYYLGDPAAGTYAMRANYKLGAQKTSNQVGNSFCIGKKVGNSGSYPEVAWDGGVNNLIISDKTLVDTQVQEFFQTGEVFTEHEYYPDLTTYARLGEDAYPAVVDSKGNATGELINGQPNDFVDIPEV